MSDNNNSLQPISFSELLETEYEPVQELVEGMLTPGLYILAGTPKVGKSFFCLQLAYALSNGESIIEKATTRGRVLYLALEDTPQRLKRRICNMFGNDAASDNLDLVTKAATLEDGLIDMLQKYVAERPDTSLIIIDTLQKIRTESSAYSSDYADLGALKSFADDNNICLLLVHHTTKTKRSDVFTMIAGSQGIYGASDGAMVLYRDSDDGACLAVQGRDIPSETYCLSFDDGIMQWRLDDETKRIHPAVKIIGDAIEELLKNTEYEKSFSFDSTVAELFEDFPQLEEIGKVNRITITKILNDNKNDLATYYNIGFSHRRTNRGSVLTFERPPQE